MKTRDTSTSLGFAAAAPMLANSGNVADPTATNDLYVSDFSSRELAGQQLDVLAPGSWVRGPFEATRASAICRGGRKASAT